METKTRINISKELIDKEKKRVIDNIMVRSVGYSSPCLLHIF